MKKVLWLIVCLMTMVVGFTSCSSNDENENSTENYSYLNGEWIDAERGTPYIIYNGWMEVMDATSSVSVAKVQFEIENNTIILKEQHYNIKKIYIFKTPTFGKIYKITPTEFEFYIFSDSGGGRVNLKRK